MSILAILASPLLGSALGTLGNWLNRREERALETMRLANAREMAKLANDHEILVAEKRLAGIIQEAQIKVEQTEAEGFRESQKAGTSKSEMLKSWMRAALVSYTALVCSILTYLVARQIGGIGSLDKAMLAGVFADAIAQFFFMFGLGFSWFFGARGSAGSTRRNLASK